MLCLYHQSVHKYVSQEFIRSCLVSYESLPKNVFHEGWGRPGKGRCVYLRSVVIDLQPLSGTKYSGISFRRALLNTISHIGMFKHQRGLNNLETNLTFSFFLCSTRRACTCYYSPSSQAETARTHAASFPVSESVTTQGRGWDLSTALL